MIRVGYKATGPLFEKAADVVIRKAQVGNIMWLTGFIRGKVVEKTPVNTGALRASIQEEIEERPEVVTGRVLSNLEYVLPVEFGSKPHFPPIKPLELWAKRKLRLRGKAAKRAAFAIARKIAEEGTKGAFMFEYGRKEGEKQVKKTMRDLGLEIVTELGGGT